MTGVPSSTPKPAVLRHGIAIEAVHDLDLARIVEAHIAMAEVSAVLITLKNLYLRYLPRTLPFPLDVAPNLELLNRIAISPGKVLQTVMGTMSKMTSPHSPGRLLSCWKSMTLAT